jgi:hypothetical protein
MKTNEGGNQYEHTLNHALEFFSKAGSLFTKRKSYYSNEESALSLFQKTWIVDPELSFKLLLWLRDCRGGAGNRSGFRECLHWLSTYDPDWIRVNISWIPEVGRWDDLRTLFGSSVEKEAIELWAKAIKEKNVLAAKWADRKDFPLKHALGFKKEGDFRKFLARLRKNHIVEHKMSTNRWNEIEYHTVPSLAMARYTNAFNKHDENRFNKYKESLKKGETTVHADVLFPHDCIRTSRNGDVEIADAQFDALPDYMEGTNEKIIVISDTSGSMYVNVAGSILALDVSQGLALYCSAKIPENNPFHKKFIGFCSEGRFKNWNGMKFSEAIRNKEIFDGAIGSTRVDKALNLILDTAKFFNLTQEFMPTMLIIVSDMQFHGGVKGDGTEVDKALDLWKHAGYNTPKIVYWNTAGYAGSPDTVRSNNVALVSGFSPAVLKAILGGVDFSPTAVMMRALEKYSINVLE